MIFHHDNNVPFINRFAAYVYDPAVLANSMHDKGANAKVAQKSLLLLEKKHVCYILNGAISILKLTVNYMQVIYYYAYNCYDFATYDQMLPYERFRCAF